MKKINKQEQEQAERHAKVFTNSNAMRLNTAIDKNNFYAIVQQNEQNDLTNIK